MGHAAVPRPAACAQQLLTGSRLTACHRCACSAELCQARRNPGQAPAQRRPSEAHQGSAGAAGVGRPLAQAGQGRARQASRDGPGAGLQAGMETSQGRRRGVARGLPAPQPGAVRPQAQRRQRPDRDAAAQAGLGQPAADCAQQRLSAAGWPALAKACCEAQARLGTARSELHGSTGRSCRSGELCVGPHAQRALGQARPFVAQAGHNQGLTASDKVGGRGAPRQLVRQVAATGHGVCPRRRQHPQRLGIAHQVRAPAGDGQPVGHPGPGLHKTGGYLEGLQDLRMHSRSRWQGSGGWEMLSSAAGPRPRWHAAGLPATRGCARSCKSWTQSPA